MNVEIINTGTEILLGNVLNTHLGFLAQELFSIGLRVQRQVTVPDGDAIREALVESFARADIVLVTGGLGPTTDDITREVVAELLGLKMEFDAGVMRAIEVRFARRNLAVTERVKRQAQVPRGATVLPNGNGTAPGLYFPQSAAERSETEPPSVHQLQGSIRNPHLLLLPGPPRELHPMFTGSALPILKKITPGGNAIGCRLYRISGLGESQVEHLVGEDLLAIHGLELGYCARPGEVDVRCIGTTDVLEKAHTIVAAKLQPYIVSETGGSIEQTVVETLIVRGAKLAVAESCTGGALANRITSVPGASNAFLAGFVTYANEAKSSALGVEPALIAEFGAVSREVAAAMAGGALKNSGADFALSTTGIAGPTGGTPQKPVGTVFIGLAFKNAPTEVEQHLFATDRENFKQIVTQTALDLLRRNL